MELYGSYVKNEDTYNVSMSIGKTVEDGKRVEILLGRNGIVESSYLNSEKNGEYCYENRNAKELYESIQLGIRGCNAKNGKPCIFSLGTASRHEFKKTKGKTNNEYDLLMFNGNLCGAEIKGNTNNNNISVYLEYCSSNNTLGVEIPYVKITKPKQIRPNIEDTAEDEDAEMDIPVRSLEEISLDKDTEWLKYKKYYVVNDEEMADKIFRVIENWNGPVSYDTETSGLRINMFGKIGSDKKRELEEHNKNKKKADRMRVDYLVGIILCVEKDVSYYFPCANRKFKNLYSDTDNKETRRVCQNILSNYTIGEYRNREDDMAKFIRTTPIEEWGCDVILMERVRKILETRALVAHNGVFEWKVSWLYNICINLKDDTILLHGLLYKFRTTTDNKGEPSNLKYLTKVELGIDQLELSDFFVGYSEDTDNVIRDRKGKKKKKKKVEIDF